MLVHSWICWTARYQLSAFEKVLGASFFVLVVLGVYTVFDVTLDVWIVTVMVDGVMALGISCYVLLCFVQTHFNSTKGMVRALHHQKALLDSFIVGAVGRFDEDERDEMRLAQTQIQNLAVSIGDMVPENFTVCLTPSLDNVVKVFIALGASFLSVLLRQIVNSGGEDV